MAIDRWASMTGGSTPRPQVAPGTPCSPCKAKGHHCNAYEIVEGRAVCVHCLDGVDCPRMPRNGTVRSVTGPPKPVPVAVAKAPARVAVAAAAAEPVAVVTLRGPDTSLRPVKPTPQPALAAGAEASEAMPARRTFGRQNCSRCKQPVHPGPCQCKHRCGREPHRGNCSGRVVKPVAESKGLAVKPEAKPAVFSASDAAALTKRAETMAKLEKAKAVVERAAPALSAKSIAEGYTVVSLLDVPGRKPVSVYESIVADLVALPVNSVLTRTYANQGVAHTFMTGITRMVRKQGLKVCQVQEGATIYVWLKA